MIEEENPIEVEDLLQPLSIGEIRNDYHDTNYLPFLRRNREL